MKNLTNQIIIAMPHMPDDRFKKSVVLIFEHNSQGATDLVINKQIDEEISLDIIDGLNQKMGVEIDNKTPIYNGGPLSPEKGIVIHDDKALSNHCVKIAEKLFLSSHIDSIVKAQSLGRCNYKLMRQSSKGPWPHGAQGGPMEPRLDTHWKPSQGTPGAQDNSRLRRWHNYWRSKSFKCAFKCF